MKIIAVDPSSTRTGYAVMQPPGKVIEGGYLTPRRCRDEPIVRATAMGRELRDLIAGEHPHDVVVEVTSGKVQARHRGGGAGLAVYGMAVGLILGAALYGQVCCPKHWGTHWVYENEWTQGRPKDARRERLRIEYPQYAAAFAADSGGDLADAIGLGLWWFGERRKKGLL